MNTPEIAAVPDTELVCRCLEGNREAFRSLVERYQSLACSVAYAGCGDLHLSEEIAQETFLAAWRKLRDLQDPARCKSWLCGIARNLCQNAIRRRSRTAIAGAETLDENVHSPEGSPHEHAISREEEAILRCAIEGLPEIYREPMILFYREEESVSAVAEALEISEDAVKQRLSRGRVMLAVQIERTLRAALRATVPGAVFTAGVLAVISAASVSAKAATLSTATAKGATAKAVAANGIFGALLGPVLMLMGNYFGYRIALESACTGPERSSIKRFYVRTFAIVAGFVAMFDALICWSSYNGRHFRPVLLAALFITLAVAFLGSAAFLTISNLRERRRLLADRTAAGIPLDAGGSNWEYRSPLVLLGLPLIHLRLGNRFGWQKHPVTAWIAVGDRAWGVLFAFGGVAIAPLSVGGFALGLVSWGGFAAGLFALGGFSFGWWAIGGIGFGWKVFAGCALAWRGAMGGVAIAHDYANGGFAFAANANSRPAAQWLWARAFFRDTDFAGNHLQWLNLLWVLPLLQWWRVVKKRREQGS